MFICESLRCLFLKILNISSCLCSKSLLVLDVYFWQFRKVRDVFSMTSSRDRCSGSLRCCRMTTGSRSGSSPSRPRCWCRIGPEIWTKLYSFYNLQFLLSFNLFLWSNHYQNYFILLFKILFTLKSALQYKLLVWLCVCAGSAMKRFTVDAAEWNHW